MRVAVKRLLERIPDDLRQLVVDAIVSTYDECLHIVERDCGRDGSHTIGALINGKCMSIEERRNAFKK